jgi:hypothetical protein
MAELEASYSHAATLDGTAQGIRKQEDKMLAPRKEGGLSRVAQVGVGHRMAAAMDNHSK